MSAALVPHWAEQAEHTQALLTSAMGRADALLLLQRNLPEALACGLGGPGTIQQILDSGHSPDEAAKLVLAKVLEVLGTVLDGCTQSALQDAGDLKVSRDSLVARVRQHRAG